MRSIIQRWRRTLGLGRLGYRAPEERADGSHTQKGRARWMLKVERTAQQVRQGRTTGL